MEKPIRIYPRLLKIEKYFKELSNLFEPYELFVSSVEGEEGIYFEPEKYQKVEALLSEFNIHDKYSVYDFCYIYLYFEYFYWIITYRNEYDSEMISEIRKLKLFVQKHEAKGIRLYSSINAKKPSFLIKKGYLIGKVSEVLEEIIKGYTNEEFEDYPNKPGVKLNKGGSTKKQFFSELQNFFHSSCPGLDKLSEYEENYIAGKLFLLVGIIEPFEHEVKDRAGYKSERDYLAKRMEKFR